MSATTANPEVEALRRQVERLRYIVGVNLDSQRKFHQAAMKEFESSSAAHVRHKCMVDELTSDLAASQKLFLELEGIER
jgi:hypothetical protein